MPWEDRIAPCWRCWGWGLLSCQSGLRYSRRWAVPLVFQDRAWFLKEREAIPHSPGRTRRSIYDVLSSDHSIVNWYSINWSMRKNTLWGVLQVHCNVLKGVRCPPTRTWPAKWAFIISISFEEETRSLAGLLPVSCRVVWAILVKESNSNVNHPTSSEIWCRTNMYINTDDWIIITFTLIFFLIDRFLVSAKA